MSTVIRTSMFPIRCPNCKLTIIDSAPVRWNDDDDELVEISAQGDPGCERVALRAHFPILKIKISICPRKLYRCPETRALWPSYVITREFTPPPPQHHSLIIYISRRLLFHSTRCPGFVSCIDPPALDPALFTSGPVELAPSDVV